jgi:hypothetical protein
VRLEAELSVLDARLKDAQSRVQTSEECNCQAEADKKHQGKLKDDKEDDNKPP